MIIIIILRNIRNIRNIRTHGFEMDVGKQEGR